MQTIRSHVWRVRHMFGLMLLLACIAAGGGCRHPAVTPVWLSDSSGVVSGDQFFDLATKQTHVLEFPPSFPEDITRERFVSAATRTMIFTGLTRGDAPQLLLERAPLPPAQSDPTRKTAKFDVDKHDCQDVDLFPSLDGQSVLICRGRKAEIYHWATEKLIRLPEGISGPCFFERIFGISPCRPDGAGFLAIEAPERDVLKTDGSHLLFLLKNATAVVFVGWDGAIRPLAGIESFRAAENMLIHLHGEMHGAALFAGAATWKGRTATFAFGGDRLELDTEALLVRFVGGAEKVEPKTPERNRDTRRMSADESQRRMAVEKPPMVQCGMFVIEARPDRKFRPRSDSSMQVSCGEELVLLDLARGTERVMDVHSDYPLKRFRLMPSPDGEHVLVHYMTALSPNQDIQRGPYSILFNNRGEVVTTLGIDPEEWRQNVANRTTRQGGDASPVRDGRK